MANADPMTEVLKILEMQANTQVQVELRLHAALTALTGVLRAIDEHPQLRDATAKGISKAAEEAHGVALGFAVTDDYLSQRDSLLRNLLPPELKQLVNLPKHG
jgi:small nuclear ribonucleoprotein (snRNP)-like protein